MLGVVMLNFVMLSAIVLSVAVPPGLLTNAVLGRKYLLEANILAYSG